MKVFMSWSGARSKAAAELLHDWIKCVIQASRPWISTRGIGRGAVWFSEINNELRDTTVGIICLTHQNKAAPWILFEAGALAKGLTTTKVCTFLVDLAPADIQDPLAQFNHTMPDRDGMMSLAATLNSALEAPLDNNTLLSVFEAFWPQFERDFALLIEKFPQEVQVEARSESSMLEEILASTRGLSQRMRAIEERQTERTFGSHTSAWPAPVDPKPGLDDVGLDDDPGSIKFGLDKLREFAAAGMTLEDATAKLERLIGQRRTSVVVKLSKMLKTPPKFTGTTPKD